MFNRSSQRHSAQPLRGKAAGDNAGRRLRHAPWLGTLALCAAAHADPGYYVVTPYDREGLTTLDLRYWTVKRPGRPEVVWPEWAIGRGLNSRWTTTLLGSYIGSSQNAVHLTSLSWQNVVLLTQGEWPVDVAVYGAFTRSIDGSFHHAVEWGPLFQTDVGRTQLNLNLMFDKVMEKPSSDPTQLKYQWQVKHRVQPGWQLGLQGFGEVGTWNDWKTRTAQSHRAGPAVFAQLGRQGQGLWELHAALLVGRTYGKSGHMFSARTAYSF